MTYPRTSTWGRRTVAILCLPLILILMLCDAMGCAWDEFASDWRSLRHWLTDEWRDE